jgi:hypothetical protein
MAENERTFSGIENEMTVLEEKIAKLDKKLAALRQGIAIMEQMKQLYGTVITQRDFVLGTINGEEKKLDTTQLTRCILTSEADMFQNNDIEHLYLDERLSTEAAAFLLEHHRADMNLNLMGEIVLQFIIVPPVVQARVAVMDIVD